MASNSNAAIAIIIPPSSQLRIIDDSVGVFLSSAIKSIQRWVVPFSLSSLFTLGQGSVLSLFSVSVSVSFLSSLLFFSLFFLCKISASGRSILISAIVSPFFLSELLALRYLCLACGGPLPSEYPTWPLDPGVARRVRNSSGQQMRDCTLSRGVGSASGLNRFTETMKGLGVGWW